MHLTPDILEASYKLLCLTLPFRRWRLPHPDNIDFKVLITKEWMGHHRGYVGGGRHEIAISAGKVKTLDMLNQVMAHEIVHMRQDILRLRTTHGPSFKRLARLVCRRHSFDLKKF